MHLTRQWYIIHFIREGFKGILILTERFHHLQVLTKMSVLPRSGFLKGVKLPLVPFWAGSVSSLSLWLDRLNRRWMRPRSLTLSSLSEDGMERLRSSSMDRSESESESSPGERRREEQMKKWNRCVTPVRQMSKYSDVPPSLWNMATSRSVAPVWTRFCSRVWRANRFSLMWTQQRNDCIGILYSAEHTPNTHSWDKRITEAWKH